MAELNAEVDRLYQLPLAEFTAARDALAKGAGAHGASVKKLQKPNAAAWAVNQLYWRRRKQYDRLVESAERLRAAHSKRLAGREVDLADVESAHKDAVKAAADEIRGLLGEVGESASPATLTSVMETLQALPSAEPPGRLVRPLKPLGFEALSTLIGGGSSNLKRPARVLPFDATKAATPPSKADERTAKQRAEAEKREARAREREAAKIQQQLREARTTERQAQAALERVRESLERTERDRERAEKELETLAERRRTLTTELSRREQEAATAVLERQRLERRLESARQD